MKASSSLPVLPGRAAREGGPSSGRIVPPPPQLPTGHFASWRAARSGAEERLERLQAQFEPRLPLSAPVRRKYMAEISSEEQLKANVQSRTGRDVYLRRRDSATEVGGPASKGAAQSQLIERELELVEACEVSALRKGDSDAAVEAAASLATATVRALDACANLAPIAFAPILSRVSAAIQSLLYSTEHTDDYGKPLLYKTALERVAARQMSVDAAKIELLQSELDITNEKLHARDEAVIDAKMKAAAAERLMRRAEMRVERQQQDLNDSQHERIELEERVAKLTADAESVIEGRIAKLMAQIERLNEEIARCRETENALIEQVEKGVPRDEHEAVLAEFAELSIAHEKLRNTMSRSVATNPTVLPTDSSDATTDAIELAQLRMTHSPRPAWSQLRDRADREAIDIPSDVVGASFGQRRPWIDPNKSTAYNVNALYASYRGARKRIAEYDLMVPNEDPFFRAIGDGPAVPAHLRWPNGERLRNWRLPKREVEDAVRDFWEFFYSEENAYKLEAQMLGEKLALADHFDAFIRQYPAATDFVPQSSHQEGGLMRSIREYSYNIIDGCKRYRYDADMELFLEVITGRLPEDTHRLQMQMLASLLDAFVAEDQVQHRGAAKGRISHKAIPAVLRKVFPTRTEAQISILVSTIDDDKGVGVLYEELFEEDQDGNQSSFIERVRDQWLRAPREFVNQIEAAICGNCGYSDGMVTRHQAVAAIHACDPKKPAEEVERLVGVGFGDASAAIYGDDCRLELSVFSQRLLLAFPTRSGKPPATMPGVREARRPVTCMVRRSPTRQFAAYVAGTSAGLPSEKAVTKTQSVAKPIPTIPEEESFTPTPVLPQKTSVTLAERPPPA